MADISLDNLSFRYPGSSTDTISALSLDIANGEAHALLGASGAGKTTLLNLLSGLLTPTSGKLRFGDRDVSGLAGRDRNVAQVFQFPVLYESLSVRDNLVFPLASRGFDKKQIGERVDYIADELSIASLRDRKPDSLTLSEKQLVAVGKALVRPDVSLVLLDEPLTAVEPKLKWQLRQTLRKAQADLGVTMIYVTHDQTEALTFAERVSVLTGHGILQTGTPKEVYESPDHEFVGHFVGSPGMNFVPGSALDIADGDRAGFRPEWASINEHGVLSGTVKRVRVQATHHGQPHGIVTVSTIYGDMAVRGPASIEVGTATALRIERYVAFSAQKKVGEVAYV